VTYALPSQEENPKGLHRRYDIKKADGSPVDPRGIYFVLRLDGLGDDPLHIRASRKAALAYATAICNAGAEYGEPSHLDQLGRELLSLVINLDAQPGA
jgi:hypothetical protein